MATPQPVVKRYNRMLCCAKPSLERRTLATARPGRGRSSCFNDRHFQSSINGLKRLLESVHAGSVANIEDAVNLWHVPPKPTPKFSLVILFCCIALCSSIFGTVNGGTVTVSFPLEGWGSRCRSFMYASITVRRASDARRRASSLVSPKYGPPGNPGSPRVYIHPRSSTSPGSATFRLRLLLRPSGVDINWAVSGTSSASS